MESRESEAFCFLEAFLIGEGGPPLVVDEVGSAFGSLKICRVSFLVQAQINLHGYFYVALQLKIQR